jgi:hypothetical protein
MIKQYIVEVRCVQILTMYLDVDESDDVREVAIEEAYMQCNGDCECEILSIEEE